jgi:hypothetical protein
MGEQCSVVLRIILQAAQTDERIWPIRIRPLMLLLKQRQQWGKHKPEILPQDGSNDNNADVGSQQQYHTTINSPGVAILVISNRNFIPSVHKCYIQEVLAIVYCLPNPNHKTCELPIVVADVISTIHPRSQ